MKKTILLLGAVGVLMMTGCADEGITTDYGEWVATSEYSMDGTTENYRTIEVDATAEKTEAASEKETEESSDQMDAQKKDSTTEKTDGTEDPRGGKFSCLISGGERRSEGFRTFLRRFLRTHGEEINILKNP